MGGDVPIYLIRAGEEFVRFAVCTPNDARGLLATVQHGSPLPVCFVGMLWGASLRLKKIERAWAARHVRDGWYAWSDDMLSNAQLKPQYKPRQFLRNQEIVALLRAGGKTFAEVGAIYGLTRERIRQIAIPEGITSIVIKETMPLGKAEADRRAARERRDARRARKDALIARACELRESGMKHRQIMEVMGLYRGQASALLIAGGKRTLDRNTRRRINQNLPSPEPPPKPRKAPIAPASCQPGRADRHDPGTIEAARRLWDIEGLSASRIAARLTSPSRTISKCAVIGIAHRNGFKPKPSPLRSVP